MTTFKFIASCSCLYFVISARVQAAASAIDPVTDSEDEIRTIIVLGTCFALHLIGDYSHALAVQAQLQLWRLCLWLPTCASADRKSFALNCSTLSLSRLLNCSTLSLSRLLMLGIILLCVSLQKTIHLFHHFSRRSHAVVHSLLQFIHCLSAVEDAASLARRKSRFWAAFDGVGEAQAQLLSVTDWALPMRVAKTSTINCQAQGIAPSHFFTFAGLLRFALFKCTVASLTDRA